MGTVYEVDFRHKRLLWTKDEPKVIPIRVGHDPYGIDYWNNRDLSFEEKKAALERSIFGPQRPSDTEQEPA